MRITERQARQRLAKAIEAAGSPAAIARRLPMKPKSAQSAVSRSLSGRMPVQHTVLAVLGLRRDENGDIFDDRAPSSFIFVAVQASGEAGVAAAVALIGAVLGAD